MKTDIFEHMEEAWKIEQNPFPTEGHPHSNADQPYSEDVFPDETNEFRRKLIRGGIKGGQAIGFLWSQGARAERGFGKTTLMQEITVEINKDQGVTTLGKAGAKKAGNPIAAAFSNLNNLNAAGLYPVLFNAVLDLAAARHPNRESVFENARERIIEELGTRKHKADPAARWPRLLYRPECRRGRSGWHSAEPAVRDEVHRWKTSKAQTLYDVTTKGRFPAASRSTWVSARPAPSTNRRSGGANMNRARGPWMGPFWPTLTTWPFGKPTLSGSSATRITGSPRGPYCNYPSHEDWVDSSRIPL